MILPSLGHPIHHLILVLPFAHFLDSDELVPFLNAETLSVNFLNCDVSNIAA